MLCDLLHVSHPPGQMGVPGYVLQVTTGVEDHKPCCVGTLCHIYQYSTGPNKPHGQTQGQMVGKFLFFLWEELQSCLTIFLDTALGEEQGSRIQLIILYTIHLMPSTPCELDNTILITERKLRLRDIKPLTMVEERARIKTNTHPACSLSFQSSRLHADSEGLAQRRRAMYLCTYFLRIRKRGRLLVP